MSITRKIEGKVVKLSSENKENLFKILEQVLTSVGLIGPECRAAIADLEPGPPYNLSRMIEQLKAKGTFGQLIVTILPTDNGRELKPCEGRFSKAAAELYDNYLVSWITKIRGETNLVGNNLYTMVTDSSRVFIAEIYNRLIFQALRSDSKLPPEKTRQVWLEVMKEITAKLLNPSTHNLLVILDEDFRFILAKLFEEWINPLDSAVERIEQLNLADKIINANIANLEAQRCYMYRHIIAHLAGKENADKKWQNELSNNIALRAQLTEYENKWIKKKKPERPDDLKVLVINNKSAKPKDEEWAFSYDEIDLASQRKEMQEVAKRRKMICSSDPDGKLTPLYGWLYLNEFVLDILQDISNIFQYGGWIPFLLEGFDLHKLHIQINLTYEVFHHLTIINTFDFLQGTKLHAELLRYVPDKARLKLKPINSFEKLESKKLLTLVKKEFSFAIQSVIQNGNLLGCPILSADQKPLIEEYLDPSQIKLLEQSQPSTSLKVEEVIDEKQDKRDDSREKDKAELKSPDISAKKSEKTTLLMRGTSTMKTEYIKLYFQQRKLEQLNDLFATYCKSGELDFTQKFDRADFFSKSSTLVKSIRTVVRSFEALKNWSQKKHKMIWNIGNYEEKKSFA